MHSSLLSLLFLSLFSPILASPIDPSDSLPSRTTENTLDPSPTLGAPGAAGSLHCVSPRDHPDWGGPITYRDCYAALGDLSNRLGNQKWNWQLWSARYDTKPGSGHPLQLPLGATRGKPFLSLSFPLSKAVRFPILSVHSRRSISRQLYIATPHRP